MKKKVFLAIADTGMGHRSVANSLLMGFEKNYPGEFDCMISNLLYRQFSIDKTKSSDLPLSMQSNTQAVKVKNSEKAYNWSINYFPPLYSSMYFITNHCFPSVWAEYLFCGRAMVHDLARFFTQYQADIIICLHPLMSKTILSAVHLSQSKAFTAIVVTDPQSAHKSWANGTDYHINIVSSQRVKNLFLKQGIPQDKIELIPHPLKLQYQNRTYSVEYKNNIKTEYQIPKNKKIVLFTGGGEGIRFIDKYMKALLKNPVLLDDFFFIVILGKNHKQKLWAETFVKMNLCAQSFCILGFTTEMYKYMQIADLVIGKGGPSSIFESLISGVPMFITQAICQEIGNKQYVVDNQLGFFTPTVNDFIKHLHLIHKEPHILNTFQSNIAALKIFNGTESIIRKIVYKYQNHVLKVNEK